MVLPFTPHLSSPAQAWATTRRVIQERVLLIECSDRFDESLITDTLGDLYYVEYTCLSAVDVGSAGHRHRFWGIALHKVDIIMAYTTVEKVWHLFHRTVVGGFRMIMVATEEEQRRELTWLASRPKSRAHVKHVDDIMCTSHDPWVSALTAKELEFFRAYLKAAPVPGKPRVTEAWAVSLNQNPAKGFGSASDGTRFLQTIIKNVGVS